MDREKEEAAKRAAGKGVYIRIDGEYEQLKKDLSEAKKVTLRRHHQK